MASLYNNKISTTYVGLIKTIDNAVISASLKELTDGSGNATGLYVNTAGDFKVTSILEWGTLKDTGEGISITKFVDEADGIASNDNDTTIPTSAAVVDYVASRITLEDLDFSGDSGTGSVDLDSQVFAIVGTANEIETSGGSQQLQIGLPTNITIAGTTTFGGNLIGNTNIILKDTSDNTLAAFYSGGKGEIYFNNSKKFETTSDGVTVTGGLTATGSSVFTGASFSSAVDVTGNTTFYNDVTVTDNDKIKFGTGGDLEIYSVGTDIYFDNNTGDLYFRQEANDKDIIFQSDDGSGGYTTYLALDGSQTNINVQVDFRIYDNKKLQLGNGADLEIYHDASNSYISNTGTGDLRIKSQALRLQGSDGSDLIQADEVGGVRLYDNGVQKLEVGSSGAVVTGTVTSDGIVLGDNESVLMGTAGDFSLKHDSSNSKIENNTGHLYFIQEADNSDIIFQADDGSGATTTYLQLDGGDETIVAYKDLLINADDVKIKLGASQDLEIYHSGSHSYIDETGTGGLIVRTGDLYLRNPSDADYIYATSGGAVNFYYDGSKKMETTSGGIQIHSNINMNDNGHLYFGAGNDLNIYHDATDSFIINSTGILNIKNDDIRFKTAGDETMLRAVANGAVELMYDNSTKFQTTSTGVTITGYLLVDKINLGDNEKVIWGGGSDLQIYHDGSDSYIDETGTGDLIIQGSYLTLKANGSNSIVAHDNGTVYLYHSGSTKLTTTSTGVSVTGDADVSGLVKVGDDDTEYANNYLRFKSAGTGYIDHNTTSQNIIFRTSVSSSLDTTALTISANGDLSTGRDVTIAGDLTVNGTTTTVNTEHFNVEDPLISMAKDNAANTVDVGTYGKYNDGTARYLGLFSDASDSNTFKLFKGLTVEPTTTVDTSATGYALADLDVATITTTGVGTFGGNIDVKSDNANFDLQHADGDQVLRLEIDSGNDAYFSVTGSNNFYFRTNSTTALTIDGSQNSTFSNNVNILDTKYAVWGDGSDFKIHHNTTDTYLQNYTGHLYIQNNSDDKSIYFQTDDGSGGVTTYIKVDGLSNYTEFPVAARFMDNVALQFGSSNDAYIIYNGTDWTFLNSVDDGDIKFSCDDGSGGNTDYFWLDGGIAKTRFAKGANFEDSVELSFGNVTTPDLSIYHDGSSSHIENQTSNLTITNYADDGDIIFRSDDGSGGHAEYFKVDGGTGSIIVSKPMQFNDSISTYWGASDDLQIYHDGNDSYIKDNGTGLLFIRGSSAIRLQGANGESSIDANEDGAVNLYYDNVKKFETTSAGATLTGALSITGDGSNAATLTESSAGILTIAAVDDLKLDCGGDLTLDAGGNDIRLKVDGVEYGKFKDDSDDLAMFSSIQDKDILFKGNDGGSTITALTLDMSNGGSATFRDDIDYGGKLTQTGTGTNTFAGSISGTSATFNGGVTIDGIYIDGTEIDLSSGTLTFDADAYSFLDGDATFAGDILLGNGKFLQGVRNTGAATIDMIGFGSGTDILQIKGGSSSDVSISFFDTGGQIATFKNSNFGIDVVSPVEKLDTPNIAIGGSTIAGYSANKLRIDNNAGKSRFYSTGADASTRGSYEFSVASSDGSSNVPVLELTTGGGMIVKGDTSINRGNQTSGELLLGGTTDGGFIDFDGTNLQLNTQRDPNTGTFVNTGKSQAGIYLTGADADSYIRFLTNDANNSTANERMRITKSGYIGIGSSSPSSYNSRGKDLVIKKTGSDVGISIVAEASGGTNYSSSVLFADGTGGTAGYRGGIEYDHDDDSMNFSTAATERFIIQSTGVTKTNSSASGNHESYQKTGTYSKVSTGSTTAMSVVRVGHTHAVNYTVIAKIDTSNVGSLVGNTSTAYGSNGGIQVNSEAYIGNVTDIAVTYNNSNYELKVAVTYSGVTHPQIYMAVTGISNEDFVGQ